MFKKMFSEYAVYYDGKIVVLVCDNQHALACEGDHVAAGKVIWSNQ